MFMLVVASLALSAHASMLAAKDIALMQEEIGIANDAVFGDDQTIPEKDLMDLLSIKGKTTPDARLRLRSLASEILDGDAPKDKGLKSLQKAAPVTPQADETKAKAAPVAPEPAAKAVPVKPHVAESNTPKLRKPKQPVATETSASLNSLLKPEHGLGSNIAGLEDVLTRLMLGGHGASEDPSATEGILKMIEDDLLPKILEAHTTDQNKLDEDKAALVTCSTTKDTSATKSKAQDGIYKIQSPLHKECRKLEGELLTEKTTCHDELADKLEVKNLRCAEMVTLGQTLADEATNKGAITKVIGESDEAYIRRVNDHFCAPSNLAQYEEAKKKCTDATDDWTTKTTTCAGLDSSYAGKVAACTSIQKTMDNAACAHATEMKDACETYAECYSAKKAAYDAMETTVKANEKDRQAEWRATKRMKCLVEAFEDGEVDASEMTICKEKTHDTNHLVINYPSISAADSCVLPDLYPATAAYKLAEFAALPATAKGDVEANMCSGMKDGNVTYTPAKGSPTECTCEKVSLTGKYSPGDLVKCTNCLMVSKSKEKNSCPEGTKIFSPRSREDWATFFDSASNLNSPNFIVDVTRPQNGCGGCTGTPMNSGEPPQSTWVTSDDSPWWLRSTTYAEPNGDYTADCYLALSGGNADNVGFDDGSCSYKANAYYCQPTKK